MKIIVGSGVTRTFFSLVIIGIYIIGLPVFQDVRSARAETSFSPEDLPYKVYQPIVLKNSPMMNVFGVTMDYIDDTYGLSQLAAARTTWTRRAIAWATIEPVEGQRNWYPSFEQEMIASQQHGIKPIVILENTPAWALKPGFSCGAVAQNKFQALGNFVFETVRRYSAAPYFVKYWELWNEPDAYGFLGCWGDPNDFSYYGGSYYGLMLKVVYPMIKAADPSAEVLVGGLLLDCDPAKGLSCVSSRFLEGILANGGGPFFDGVSFHAYDYYHEPTTPAPYFYSNPGWNSTSSTTGPVSIKKGNYLKNLLRQYGYTQKYLINTETAIFSGPNFPTPRCYPAVPSGIESAKVYYLVQSYAVAQAQGWLGNLWFSALGFRCSALFEDDLSPLPAFLAYQNTTALLDNAKYNRQVNEFPGLMGYEYSTGSQRIWIIWSMDGQGHSIFLPVQPSGLSQILGDGTLNAESPTTNPTINVAPKFIIFTP